MEYCSFNEAFGNPLSKQIKEYDKKCHPSRSAGHSLGLNQSSQRELVGPRDISPPRTDAYDSLRVAKPHKISEADIHHSYFTAQGDIDRNLYPNNASQFRFVGNGNRYGTKISDLRQDDESLIDNISSPSDPSLDLSEPKRREYSHNFYIKKFLQDISEEGDTTSLASDEHVYDHIKKCRYCKTQIKKELVSKPVDLPKINPPTVLGYDVKEIFIIVLIGLCLILILDLFFQIGQKTK